MTSTATATALVNGIRSAIADANKTTLADLEPDDYQTETAAILRVIAGHCDTAGSLYARRDDNDRAGAAFALMETFHDAANLAEYHGTPCDFVACDPDGGEPCSTHEQLMAHAEGNHELCDHA
jgi:hypothetical protein